jgi:hypothetical protein
VVWEDQAVIKHLGNIVLGGVVLIGVALVAYYLGYRAGAHAEARCLLGLCP